MEEGHISQVGAGLQTLQEFIPSLVPENVHSLCLHGNDISRIERLNQLEALRDLNLSANAVVVMEGLQNLRNLRILNLASNRIQTIQGLQGLDRLQSLNLAHNFICSLSGLTALQGGQLTRLDLRDNLIGSLQELAVLAGLPSLRELALAGGSPGNSVCAIPSYRAAVAAALPTLELLDGQPLEAERLQQPGMQPAAAAQHMAFLQLQAFQPPPAQPAQAAIPLPAPQIPEAVPEHGVPHMPIIVHHMAAGQDPAESIADRLVQRLAQSGALQNLWGDQLPAGGQGAAAREGRMASLESRLAALLDERLRPPLEPIDVRGRANSEQEGPRRKRAAAERSGIVPARESGAQTVEELPGTEKLQKEMDRLRRDSERTLAELQQTTNEIKEQRKSAEKELQAAQAECKAKVADIKQHANKALKQMQHEILDAKQCKAELQAQARGSLDREELALQRAEGLQSRVAVLEAELLRARSDSADAATAGAAGVQWRLQEAELAWLRERQRLNDELGRSKEALHVAKQQVERMEEDRGSSSAQAASKMDAAMELARQQVVQAEQRYTEVCEKLEVAAVEREELRRSERQAMHRAQELSDSLLESQAKMKGVEEACRSAQAQLEECKRERDRCLADSAAQLRAASEAQAAAQKALAATEADFRIALQEGNKEAEALREKAQAAAAEAVNLRHALQTSTARLKEQEAALSEVTEMAQGQKSCIMALNKERAELAARSADPAQVAALRSEAAQLHERLRSFTALKNCAAEEQKLREGVEAELRRVQGELQQHKARAEQQAAEAEARLADTRRALQAAEEKAAALSKDVDDARSATKVKEAMLRSANESMVQLTAALEDAQRDACNAAAAAARTDKDAAARQSEAASRQRVLRQELEALEGALEEALSHAHTAEQRATVASKELKEKDEMLKYVAEEVDRVKAMFEDEERRLTSQRDEALQTQRDAAARVAVLQGEALAANARAADLEARLGTQPQQLEAAQAQARAAEDSAAQHREEAAQATKRVAEVEKEMRTLLNAMERQKKASALKMQQLATVVHDLQRPFLSWAPSM